LSKQRRSGAPASDDTIGDIKPQGQRQKPERQIDSPRLRGQQITHHGQDGGHPGTRIRERKQVCHLKAAEQRKVADLLLLYFFMSQDKSAPGWVTTVDY
jgi:hypothetical protein